MDFMHNLFYNNYLSTTKLCLQHFQQTTFFGIKMLNMILNRTIKPMSVPCSHYEQSDGLRRNQASAEGLLLMHRFARTELFRSSFF